MQQATITSKLQFTIPSRIAKKAGIKQGDKVDVSEENGRIILTPMKQLIHKLSGSLSMPKEWEGKDIDGIIREAKSEYYGTKKQ